MRLRFVCTFTFSIFFGSVSLAQNARWSYGLALGVNYNSYMLAKEPGAIVYHGMPGFTIGPEVSFTASEQIEVFAGAEFYTRNFSTTIDKSKYRSIDSDDPIIGPKVEPEYFYHFQYLEIPVGLKFKMNRSFYLKSSISNAFKLASSTTMTGDSGEQYKAYAISTSFGLGYSLYSKSNLSVDLEPSIRFFFNNIDRSVKGDPVNFELRVFVGKR